MSVVLAAAVVASSCDKDKPTGSLAFETPAVFVKAGEQVTVDFKASKNLSAGSYAVTTRPKGWDEPLIDAAEHTLTFKVPKEFDDDVANQGTFVLTGAPKDGKVASASLFVAEVGDAVDLGAAANSYIIPKKDTHYTFDAKHKGDMTQVLPEKIAVIWQSQASMIQYVTLEDGKGSFYVGSNDDGNLREGNAVIGAYDVSGTLIWSWHFWVTEHKIDVIPGTQIMNCNLGALNNSNASESDIQESYGLYYQWGRKDPFVGPAAYNAASNTNVAMYTGTNGRVYLKVVESTEKTGTMTYAVQHPLTFLKATDKSGYDWLYSEHSNTLWSDTKTINDPCPAGWRVASGSSFNALTIQADQWNDLSRNKYSATLLAGSEQNLFFGVGRRSYADGVIQNYYFTDAVPKSRAAEGLPWVGLYWTTGTQADNTSSALYFHYGATTLEKGHQMRRANAMPVRCVRE